MHRHSTIGVRVLGIVTAVVVALGVRYSLTAAPADQPAAQTAAPAAASNCQPGQDLIAVPEIKRSADGRLRAELELTSGKRTLWGSLGDTRCVPQDLRYFTGRSLLTPGSN